MTRSERPIEWMLTVALQLWAVLATVLALLPTGLFDPMWLMAFAAPGVLFRVLSTGWGERRLGFAQRLAVSVALVIGLSIAIYQTPHAPVPQAALTYLLLPPLAYATLRRRPLDVLHSLFLAFCLLVISSILNERTPTWLAVSFVAGAATVLQYEARRMAITGRATAIAARVHPLVRQGRRASVALACLLAFTGIYGVLRSLPLPGSEDRVRSTTTRVGVSTRFDLRSSDGGPLDLVEDRLVRARSASGPPTDLYLRCAYFDIAGLDVWEARPRPFESHDLRRRPLAAPAVAGLRTQMLELEQLEGDWGLIYVPPGTYEIHGNARLHTHTALEAYERRSSSSPVSYSVRYQDARPLAAGQPATVPVSGLTDLPPDILRRERYRDLAEFFVDQAGRDPTRLALAIARGLRQRCTYALEPPKGDSPHELDNFLFGDRRGYCMHFASALAILLRFADVPCRIAVGVYGGRDDEEDPTARVFGSADAHAWVEIPIRGLGWVPFDATPASTLRAESRRIPAAATAASGDQDVEDGSSVTSALEWLGSVVPMRAVWPWLALVGLWMIVSLRPRNRNRPSTTPAQLGHNTRWARRALVRMLRALAKRGCPRMADQSLESYARALAHAEIDLDIDAMRRAFVAYQEVRFGGRPLDDDRIAQLQRGCRAAGA